MSYRMAHQHFRAHQAKKRIIRKNRLLNRRARRRLIRSKKIVANNYEQPIASIKPLRAHQAKKNRLRKNRFRKNRRALRRLIKSIKMVDSIYKGDPCEVERWLKEGVDPNTIYYKGLGKRNSFLELAVKSIELRDVDFSGSSMDYALSLDYTGLLTRERRPPGLYCRIHVVRVLISYGANINYKNHNGSSVLAAAYRLNRSWDKSVCYAGNYIIGYLNARQVQQDNINRHHENQMSVAVYFGSYYYVKLSIQRGANINSIDRFGKNVFTQWCWPNNGGLKHIRYILNAGVDHRYHKPHIDPLIKEIADNFPNVRCLVNLCISSIFTNQVLIPSWVPPVFLKFSDETQKFSLRN